MANVLYIMVGISGSGKSVYAKENLLDENTIYVSRDIIRRRYISDTPDEYFKYEGQVFRDFVSDITHALNNRLDVIADATHLNKASRRKLLNAVLPKLNRRPYVIAVVLDTPIKTAQKQNESREGIEKVPAVALYNQIQSYHAPTLEFEPYFDEIRIV